MSTPQHALNWFEIPVTDFDRSKTFYETVIGRSIQPLEMGPITMGMLTTDMMFLSMPEESRRRAPMMRTVITARITPYSAIVEIIKLRDTYLVRWTMPDDVRVVGVGVVKAGVFAVSYFAGTPAVAVYSAETDGRLDGKWTMGGTEGLLFSETLKKIPPGQRKPKPIKQAPVSQPGVPI